MNFQIIDFDQGSALIDKEVIKNINLEHIQFALEPKLRFRDDDDYVGASLTILYFLNGRKIVEFPTTLTIYVEGWRAFMSKKPSIEEIQKEMLPIWIETVGFDRALCALKLKDTPLSHALLPTVDYDDFIQKVAIIKDPEVSK